MVTLKLSTTRLLLANANFLDLSWYFGDDTKKSKKSKQQRREDKQDDWLIALRCDRDDHTDADYV
jgi:hypothetical protein